LLAAIAAGSVLAATAQRVSSPDCLAADTLARTTNAAAARKERTLRSRHLSLTAQPTAGVTRQKSWLHRRDVSLYRICRWLAPRTALGVASCALNGAAIEPLRVQLLDPITHDRTDAEASCVGRSRHAAWWGSKTEGP
jgi:hypothetical protein